MTGENVSPIVRQAVFLTAISPEYKAVRLHLSDLEEIVHPQGTVYEQGRFTCTDGTTWKVAILETGAGNARAALETERAISHFSPRVLVFVGVAGGVKDVQLGDVVAATRIYGYESGKDEHVFRPRPDVGESSYSMIQRARMEARKRDWRERIKTRVPLPTPKVLVAPLAAGEKVVASTRTATCRFLRRQYSDAVGVEMEGRGCLCASHANQNVRALIVRGISDLLDRKEDADTAGYQVHAAAAASAFAFALLNNLDSGANPAKGRYIIVLSATLDEVNCAKAEAIVSHLRKMSGDAELTLTRIEKGSVKFVLEGSRVGQGAFLSSASK